MRAIALGLLVACAVGGQAAPLYEVAGKQVRVRCGSTGSYSGARLELNNVSGERLEVELMGSYLEPLRRRGSEAPTYDDGIQRLALGVSTGESPVTTVVLEAGQRWVGSMRSFCIDPGIASPNEKTAMRVSRAPVPPLVAYLLRHWRANPKLSQQQVQNAIWTVQRLPADQRGDLAADGEGHEAALAALRKAMGRAIPALMGSVQFAVTPDGQVMLSRAGLEDLRAMGVEVPPFSRELLVAAEGKESLVPLVEPKGADGQPISVLRYLSAGGLVLAVTREGVLAYDAGTKRWVAQEGAPADACDLISRGDRRFLRDYASGRIYRQSGANTWSAIGARAEQIVLAPRTGELMRVERGRGQLMAWSEGKKRGSKPIIIPRERRWYGATAGRMFCFDPAAGGLRVLDGKRWVRVKLPPLRAIHVGEHHAWLIGRAGELFVYDDKRRTPRKVSARVPAYIGACIRGGDDRLYLKARAHLVIVFKTDQEERKR